MAYEPNSTDLELSTITLTRHERVVIARSLVMAFTIMDALDQGGRELLELHSRIMPEDEL